MKNTIIIVLIVCFTVGLVYGQEKKSIAVLELDAGGISTYEAQVLTNRLRTELFKTEKFNVLERDKMDEILIEQGFQLSACTTNECAVEVGKLTGVEQMVAGNVAKIDNLFTINIRLIDVETGNSAEITLDSSTTALYRQRLQEWQLEIASFCRRRGVHFVPVTTDIPWEKLVMQTLRARSMVK